MFDNQWFINAGITTPTGIIVTKHACKYGKYGRSCSLVKRQPRNFTRQ
jgi:hypothetical protein